MLGVDDHGADLDTRRRIDVPYNSCRMSASGYRHGVESPLRVRVVSSEAYNEYEHLFPDRLGLSRAVAVRVHLPRSRVSREVCPYIADRLYGAPPVRVVRGGRYAGAGIVIESAIARARVVAVRDNYHELRPALNGLIGADFSCEGFYRIIGNGTAVRVIETQYLGQRRPARPVLIPVKPPNGLVVCREGRRPELE